jgi:hypothetical protein
MNALIFSSLPQPHAEIEPFCQQIPVLAPSMTQELKAFVNSQDKEAYFEDQRNGRWGLQKKVPRTDSYQDPNTLWYEVRFDSNYQVVNEEVTQPFHYCKQFDCLQRATRRGLEAMAKAMDWKNETHLMAISVMQHQLEVGQTTPGIEYHYDSSHYTLVVMLDNAQGASSGWKGGELLFRIRHSFLNCMWKKVFQPKCGEGILFSNKGTEHAVTPMIPYQHGAQAYVDRTILTIHELSLKEKQASSQQQAIAQLKAPRALLIRILSKIHQLMTSLLNNLSFEFFCPLGCVKDSGSQSH